MPEPSEFLVIRTLATSISPLTKTMAGLLQSPDPRLDEAIAVYECTQCNAFQLRAIIYGVFSTVHTRPN